MRVIKYESDKKIGDILRVKVVDLKIMLYMRMGMMKITMMYLKMMPYIWQLYNRWSEMDF